MASREPFREVFCLFMFEDLQTCCAPIVINGLHYRLLAAAQQEAENRNTIFSCLSCNTSIRSLKLLERYLVRSLAFTGTSPAYMFTIEGTRYSLQQLHTL